MSFIRVKKIRKKEKEYRYAYLVENKWRKRLKGGRKGSRQKVGKYLGKVVNFDAVRGIGFFEYNNISSDENIDAYLKSKSKERIVSDLVKHALFLMGFEEKGKNMEKDGLYFDTTKRGFFIDEDEQRIVIEANEGFICKYTLGKLINFKKVTDDEREIGIELAKTFLEAGLKAPNEIFVGYFEKL